MQLLSLTSVFLSCFAAVSSAWDGWSTNDTDLVMGMNVGSYFIPETWMMQSWVDCYAGGLNDTWAIQSLPNVSTIMINHLENFIREVDISDAAARGVNMLRIPIAFWMFIPTEGNEPYWTDTRQRDVYLVQLMQWALKYNMEVLIDIHALPGGQNTDEHSGRDLVVAGLQPEFLNSTNLLRGNATVDAVIDWIQSLPSNLSSLVAIIEVANEPDISAANAYELLIGYYQASYAKISAKLPNVWMMIGDGWLGVQSWGDVFTPDQNVVLDLHWWNNFGVALTLVELQDSYCSLPPASTQNAWKNPVLIGEFAAAQNNDNDTNGMTDLETLGFYQTYYATQLWAARGSNGRLPLYRGAFVWSMICMFCGNAWQPYYIAGGSDTLAITAPNWCNATGTTETPTDPNQLSLNPSPTHTANSCGVYQQDDATSTANATSSTTSGTAKPTKKGAASQTSPSKPLLIVMSLFLVLLSTI